jgi:hypothetical protein
MTNYGSLPVIAGLTRNPLTVVKQPLTGVLQKGLLTVRRGLRVKPAMTTSRNRLKPAMTDSLSFCRFMLIFVLLTGLAFPALAGSMTREKAAESESFSLYSASSGQVSERSVTNLGLYSHNSDDDDNLRATGGGGGDFDSDGGGENDRGVNDGVPVGDAGWLCALLALGYLSLKTLKTLKSLKSLKTTTNNNNKQQ